MKAKPLFIDHDGIVNPIQLSERVGFPVEWIVGFNESFEPDDHHEMIQWLTTNCRGRAVSADRGPPMGPSGEVLFEHYDDAMMCMLVFG